MSIFKIIAPLLLSFVASLEAQAQTYSFDDAIAGYIKSEITQPKPEEDGRIQTLNRRGAVSPGFDEAKTEFMKFAHGKKVLEINGIYGQVMIKTLVDDPAVTFHINDSYAHHLFIAAHNLQKAHVAKSALVKTKFIEGDITKGLDIADKYDAILVSRTLHFFNPNQLEAAIENIKKLLKPGGRVYVVAITPYVKRFDKFIPEYEKRVAHHEEFPGYVKSLQDWVNKDVTSKSQLATISPEPFMFLDDVVLTRLFKKHGYKIVACKMTRLVYKSASWSLDGRENVVLIAERED